MNIFKKFKKTILKKRNKYKEIERLFDEIVALCPDGDANIMIHNINLKELDRRIWKIDSESAERYNRKKYFDITLFGRKENL